MKGRMKLKDKAEYSGIPLLKNSKDEWWRTIAVTRDCKRDGKEI